MANNRMLGPIWRQVLLRRLLMVLFDGLLIVVSFLGAYYLRLQATESFRDALQRSMHLLPLAVASGLPVLFFSGWYRGLTRYAGSHSLYTLIPRTTAMVMVLLLLSTMIGGPQPPRSFWILYWLLFTGGAIASRIVLRDLLVQQLERRQGMQRDASHPVPTLIYGAGSSGLSLLIALRHDPRFRIVAFLDDDSLLHGRTLQRLSIENPRQLPLLIERHRIRQVLLALPSISRKRKRLLVDQLTHQGLSVLSIPSLAQLASNQRIVTDLQPVAIEDLLGREPSIPEPQLLRACVTGKAVMVTGAGGSIGSELCRQILDLEATRLLLLERNEFALYSIDSELQERVAKSGSNTEVIAVLGDCTNPMRLDQICQSYGINTIFHAAAYKHVPMVEANLCAGVSNNVQATMAVIDAARNNSVSHLILISTDKAVRPTNAMGASKRVCELLIQSAAAEVAATGKGPIMAMVRFGNVLGSSGSVIPMFHRQIAAGGPITVTHPAITRYFMTIPEAVQLVLQASGMARGGDLFLLDMGDPVRIADLARQMIELSGLRVRDELNPDGDITIQYTGLRPGEKLYEELLISADDQPTDHPLIRRANEPMRPSRDLQPLVEALCQATSRWDEQATSALLRRLVPEYRPERPRGRQSGATPPVPDPALR
ncbi:MAG: polysaccharide biosynthesis protein [Synechococcaceae cyanobacterium]|jgi:FlaA1/EpsC-like NDP-sugar epimerase